MARNNARLIFRVTVNVVWVSKGKSKDTFVYKERYPVLGTAQSALHVLPR